jgi:type II secretory ATPase GspE/PulE/Tfp pilus assembly ATPase PilB-like protein
MVGEIRDEETAAISVQSALTGHLVFSTLHTNDSASTVTRLSDMGIENYLIASTVIGVLAQRLVRHLCPECKNPLTLSEQEKEETGLDNNIIYESKGCNHCRNTGYSGRLGIFELMTMSSSIQEAITAGATTREIKQISIKEGMETLRSDALKKVSSGVTSIAEVNRVTGQ